MGRSRFDFATTYPDVDMKELVRDAIAAIGARDTSLVDKARPILDYAVSHPERFPNLQAEDSKTYAGKWAARFVAGYDKRCLASAGAKPRTVSEPLLSVFVAQLLEVNPDLAGQDRPGVVEEIHILHQYAMAIENITGKLLEEYIDSVASSHGWYYCWGESLRAVDFFKPGDNPKLLQVKNRNNSENSSSSDIRSGTPILKWHRMNANSGHKRWKKARRNS